MYDKSLYITVSNSNMLHESCPIDRCGRSSGIANRHHDGKYDHSRSSKEPVINVEMINSVQTYGVDSSRRRHDEFTDFSTSFVNEEDSTGKQNKGYLGNQNVSMNSLRDTAKELSTGQRVKLRGRHRRINTQPNTVFKNKCENIRTGIKKGDRRIINQNDLSSFASKMSLGMLQPLEKSGVLSERDIAIENRMMRQISDFRRSAQLSERSLFNSSISNEDTITCANHHDKKAKYRVQDCEPSEVVYCSKCAVSMLQQGYQIQQLRCASLSHRISKSGNKVKQSRAADLSNLESAIKQTMHKVESRKLPNDSLSSINQQIIQTESAYKCIAQLLCEMKARDLERLNCLISHKSKSYCEQNERNKYYLKCIRLLKWELQQEKQSIRGAQQVEFNQTIRKYYEQLSKIQSSALKLPIIAIKHRQSQSMPPKPKLTAIMGEIVQKINRLADHETHMAKMLSQNQSQPKPAHNYVFLQNDNGTPSFRKTDRRAIR